MNKIERNSRQLDWDDQYRTYSYNVTLVKMFKLGLILGAFLVPLFDSI